MRNGETCDQTTKSIFVSAIFLRELGINLCAGGILSCLEIYVSETCSDGRVNEFLTTEAKELYNQLEICSSEIEAGLYEDPKFSALRKLLIEFHKSNQNSKSLIIFDTSVGNSSLLGQLLRVQGVVPLLYQSNSNNASKSM